MRRHSLLVCTAGQGGTFLFPRLARLRRSAWRKRMDMAQDGIAAIMLKVAVGIGMGGVRRGGNNGVPSWLIKDMVYPLLAIMMAGKP